MRRVANFIDHCYLQNIEQRVLPPEHGTFFVIVYFYPQSTTYLIIGITMNAVILLL